MPRLDRLGQRLQQVQSEGLLRIPETAADLAQRRAEGLRMASSNDYLGLAQQNVSRETKPDSAGGAGASRLIFGTLAEHLELERSLADWVGMPAALLFSSGYAANLGLLQSLVDPDAAIVSDQLNHASIIDGCRLTRAEVHVVDHCDPTAVERALEASARASARWVVTESYFSMDGTSPDLPHLKELCDRHDAYLVVDEAHAVGLFGPEGGGLCRMHSVRPDVLVATLGKAVGLQGAAVCGSEELRLWLYNRARSFVFSTAPSPALCAAACERIRWLRGADEPRARLLEAASTLRARLARAGVATPEASHGPIIPVLLGDNARALEACEALRRHGFAVQAIRPPTVPRGSARLRVTVTANLSPEDLERLAHALLEVAR